MFRFVLPAFLLVAGVATAGEFNKVLSVGDPAPGWKDLEGTDGKTHALADLKDKPVVVVVFTCNSCPVAADYEDRVIAFAKAHPDVAVVAINPNTVPDDRLPKMKERADKKKFPFAYLADPTQATAKAFGAQYTPEFFVLNKDRKVVYMGALDDKSKAADAKVNFLDAAVKAATGGTAAEPKETLARGCRIRWVRQ